MWLTVTKVADDGRGHTINIPETKLNMDRIVQIIPRRNDGCTLVDENGAEIKVLELLNYFDQMLPILQKNGTYTPTEPVVNTAPVYDDATLSSKILDVLKNSVKGPNSEVNRRIKTMVRDMMTEIVESKAEEPAQAPRVHRISNTTANLGL